MSAVPILTASGALDHLAARGLALASDATAVLLDGGVSSAVFLVKSGEDRWVVKQPLEQLRTRAEWHATTERGAAEARAIDLLHGVTPDAVPRLVDFDPAAFVVVMTAAPPDWTNWRDDMLAGRAIDGGLAARLGKVLGRWHRETWGDAAVREQFDDDAAFEQLRTAPFHRTIARLHPGLPGLDACIDDLVERRDCLVHGDFTPKNVVAGDSGSWMLDYEVAHVGAAVFDAAMLTAHLALKAVHRPADAGRFRAAADRFLAAYRDGWDASEATRRLGWHTAAVLLARVDGTSPAGYLTEIERDRVRVAAVRQLRDEGMQDELDWASLLSAGTVPA